MTLNIDDSTNVLERIVTILHGHQATFSKLDRSTLRQIAESLFVFPNVFSPTLLYELVERDLTRYSSFWTTDTATLSLEPAGLVRLLATLPRDFTIAVQKRKYTISFFGARFSEVLAQEYASKRTFPFDFEDPSFIFVHIASYLCGLGIRPRLDQIKALREMALNLQLTGLDATLERLANGCQGMLARLCTLKRNLNSIQGLQDQLFHLTDRNLAEQSSAIQKVWFDSPRQKREFTNNVLLVARTRPELGSILAKLVSAIGNDDFRSYLANRLDSCPPRFAYELTRYKVLAVNDVLQFLFRFLELRRLGAASGSPIDDLCFAPNSTILAPTAVSKSLPPLLFWFLPEFAERFPSLTAELTEPPNCFPSIDLYRRNNWAALRECRESGGYRNELAAAIATDNSAAACLILSTNNFSYSLPIDIGPQEVYPLPFACVCGSVNCAELLLRLGAPVSADTVAAATRGGNDKLVKRLIERIAPTAAERQQMLGRVAEVAALWHRHDLLLWALKGLPVLPSKLLAASLQANNFVAWTIIIEAGNYLTLEALVPVLRATFWAGFESAARCARKSIPGFMVEVTASVSAYTACLAGIGASGINLVPWFKGDEQILPSREYGIKSGVDLGLVLRAAVIYGHLDLADEIAGQVSEQVCTAAAVQAIEALAAASPAGSVVFVLPRLPRDFDFTSVLETAARAMNNRFIEAVLPVALEQMPQFNLGPVIREIVVCGNVGALELVADLGQPLQFPATGLDWKNSGPCLERLFQVWNDEDKRTHATAMLPRLLEVGDTVAARRALDYAAPYEGLFRHVGECGDLDLAQQVLASIPPHLMAERPAQFLNLVTSRGTALSAACLTGNAPLVELLLGIRGIDATLPNWRTGPLRCAARARSVPILGLLVQHLRRPGGELPNSQTQALGSALCAILRTKPPKPIDAPQEESREAKPVERASPAILADPAFFKLTQDVLTLIQSLRLPLGRREKGRLLLQAAKTKNMVLLQAVLQFPEVNVNVCDKRGDTPLLLCCRNHDVEGIRLLFTVTSLKLNAQNAFGETAFSIAASLGQEDVVRLLRKRRVDLEESNASLALIGAILHGHSAIIDMILKREFIIRGAMRATFDGRIEVRGPLHAAIVTGEWGLVHRFTTDQNAEVHRGTIPTALFDAISARSLPIFQNLLGLLRSDINIPRRNGRSLLAHALFLNVEDIVTFIIRQGSFRLADHDPAACLAATRSEDLILELLNAGARDATMLLPLESGWKPAPRLNAPPCPGAAKSLLTRLIDLRADRVLEALIEDLGADLTAKDSRGMNALHAALYANAKALYRLLLSPGIDVDMPDGYGQTPLIIAVKTKNSCAAMWLIERGCKLEEKDNDGKTAPELAFAVAPKHRALFARIITMLLSGAME